MNDKNRALLFGEDENETITITLTDEDGHDIDAEIIAAVEIEELEKEFVAALPTHSTADFNENEALILEYSEDKFGDPVFSPIEDEELFEVVGEVFNEFFENMGEDEAEDDEEDDETGYDDDYLSDIGDIIPGVSIKKI